MATKKKKKRGPNQTVRVRRLLKKCHELWSTAVRLRDGKCVRCGATDKQLFAHHWILNKAKSLRYRYSTLNGVALCYGCHMGAVHRDASVAIIMSVFDGQKFIGWSDVLAIIETSKQDTRETSRPYTEEQLLNIAAGLEQTIGSLKTRNAMMENPALTPGQAKQSTNEKEKHNEHRN